MPHTFKKAVNGRESFQYVHVHVHSTLKKKNERNTIQRKFYTVSSQDKTANNSHSTSHAYHFCIQSQSLGRTQQQQSQHPAGNISLVSHGHTNLRRTNEMGQEYKLQSDVFGESKPNAPKRMSCNTPWETLRPTDEDGKRN